VFLQQLGTVKSLKNTAQAITKQRLQKINEKWTRARFGMHLGIISGVNLMKNTFFVEKMSARQQTEKKCPQQ
jgi:hypothetical protein